MRWPTVDSILAVGADRVNVFRLARPAVEAELMKAISDSK